MRRATARPALVVALFLVSASAAFAQKPPDHPPVTGDFIVTEGQLTDEEFYRLVSCGAQPGGACLMPYVRWPAAQARALRVALAAAPRSYPPALARALRTALPQAIAEINGSGAAVGLRQARAKDRADIVIRPMDVSGGERVNGSDVPELEGRIMGAAFVYIWWNGLNQITDARILMADDLPLDAAYPVLLEELTQALGFMTDIRNPAYRSISVFSEDSNAVTALGRQDIAALRRHYPR